MTIAVMTRDNGSDCNELVH